MTMAAQPQSPSHDGFGSVPLPSDPVHLSRGYGPGSGSRPNSYLANSIAPSDYGAAHGGLVDPSPLAHSTRFNEELDASQRVSSLLDGVSASAGLQRSESQMSHHSLGPSRGGTLKKKPSLSKKGSLKRSSSRKSLRAGSVRSLHLGEKKYGGEDVNSAFYVPIPTGGSPTDELANRFQGKSSPPSSGEIGGANWKIAWRKVLKDLIIFFKDIQKSYETRAKLLLSTSNIINNMTMPSTFLESGGLGDATEILRSYHRQGLLEANRAKEVENEVVMQLTGLRSDLQQKTKEIKSLSGDFKNNVDKEVEGTRKAVRNLQETLGLVDVDPAATSGKHDPFILRLGVQKQLEKQIEEENYLHRVGFCVCPWTGLLVLTRSRHISIWKVRVASLSLSSSARFRKHTMHTRAFLSGRRTRPTTQSRSFEPALSRCPKTTNGTILSPKTINWLIPGFRYGTSRTSPTLGRTIPLLWKCGPACWNGRANT